MGNQKVSLPRHIHADRARMRRALVPFARLLLIALPVLNRTLWMKNQDFFFFPLFFHRNVCMSHASWLHCALCYSTRNKGKSMARHLISERALGTCTLLYSPLQK